MANIEIDRTPVAVTTHDGDVAYQGEKFLFDPERNRYLVFNEETGDSVWVPRTFLIFP